MVFRVLPFSMHSTSMAILAGLLVGTRCLRATLAPVGEPRLAARYTVLKVPSPISSTRSNTGLNGSHLNTWPANRKSVSFISVLRIPVTLWYGFGSASLTNGIGSGSWSSYFCQWPSRLQQQKIFKFFANYFLKLHYFSLIKKDVTNQ